MTPSLSYIGRVLLTKLCRMASILAMEAVLCYSSCALTISIDTGILPQAGYDTCNVFRVRSAGNRQTSRRIAPSHADDPSTDGKRQEHVVP